MDIGPLIGQLRNEFHQLGQAELARFLAAEEQPISTLQKEKMETAVNRVINKLLHRLINNFHTIAENYGSDEAQRLIESIIEYKGRNASCRHRHI